MMTTTVTLGPDLQIPFTESGTGRPVLILHGGGGPFTVAPIADHLSNGMHTMIPTHPGWNGVPRPEWFSGIDDLALAYLHYLEDAGLNDVLVIGSSIGGWIAAEMALRDNAGRISDLILIDAAGVVVEGEPVRDFFSLTAREVAEYSYHDADRFYVDPATIPAAQRAVRTANMATMRVIAGDMQDPKLLRRLARVRIPVLVVWGDSDRLFTPAYGAAYAAAFAHARMVVIADAGHLPQIEQPAATFASIDAFLNDSDLRAPMDAIVLEPGGGRPFTTGPVAVSVKEDGAHTRGTLAAAEFTVPPHTANPPLHVHRAHEEGFYVLEGEFEFMVGGKWLTVRAGGWVLVPIGVPHTFRNAGETPARFFNTFTPDRYIHYFDDVAAAGMDGLPSPAQMAAIMARYNTDVIGAPAPR